nr:hypothetical protein [Stenotrophomonas maltophilia]
MLQMIQTDNATMMNRITRASTDHPRSPAGLRSPVHAPAPRAAAAAGSARTDATLVRTAQLQGLAIAPSSAFCPAGVLHQHGVRLSLGLAADRRQLESALRRIDRLLLSDALPAIER